MKNYIENNSENTANKPNGIVEKDEKTRISDAFARNLENLTLVTATILILVFSIAAVVEFVSFLDGEGGGLMHIVVYLTAIVVTLISRWAIILFVRMYEYQKLSAEMLSEIVRMNKNADDNP